MNISLWIRATRAPFFTASIIPIILGAILAFNFHSKLNFWVLFIALMAGILIHAGTNLINDYFDIRTDSINKNPTQFNGGSQVIQQNLLSRNQILIASVITFSLGSILFIYLELLYQDFIVLGLSLLGLCIAIFYSAGPIKLSHRGLGEFFCFLGYGPILVLISWHTQIQNMEFFIPLFWSFIPGLFIGQILLINEFPDVEADSFVDKNTLVVRLSRKRSLTIYQINFVLVYAWIIIGSVFYFNYAFFALFGLFTVPLAIKAINTAKAYYNDPKLLLPSNALTVQIHLFTGILVIVGIAISGMIF